MKQIEFIRNPIDYVNNSEFVALLPHVNGADDLHKELSDILKFPNYYGENWNALYDCLRDFGWIDMKGIVLVHIAIPSLSDFELKTYIEILFESAKDWKEGDEHYFKVIFPLGAEKLIRSIINQCP